MVSLGRAVFWWETARFFILQLQCEVFDTLPNKSKSF